MGEPSVWPPWAAPGAESLSCDVDLAEVEARDKLASSDLSSSPVGVGASTWNLRRDDGLLLLPLLLPLPTRLDGLAMGSEWRARDLRPLLERKTDVRLMICENMSPDCSQIPLRTSTPHCQRTDGLSLQDGGLTLFHGLEDVFERANLVFVIHLRCPDLEVDCVGERETAMPSSVVAL